MIAARFDPAPVQRASGAQRTTHRIRACVAALAVAIALGAPAARAQDAAATWAPHTGDAWVDATLADINRYAARYPDAFADELVRYDNAPRALVQSLLADPRWTPGDVYFACALGAFAGQPCRAVAQQWQQDPAGGWVAVAQDFGIGMQSPAFHRLKRGIVSTYARWGRPLQVDASLHAEFPKLPLAPDAADAGQGADTPAAAPAPRGKTRPARARRGKGGAA